MLPRIDMSQRLHLGGFTCVAACHPPVLYADLEWWLGIVNPDTNPTLLECDALEHPFYGQRVVLLYPALPFTDSFKAPWSLRPPASFLTMVAIWRAIYVWRAICIWRDISIWRPISVWRALHSSKAWIILTLRYQLRQKWRH